MARTGDEEVKRRRRKRLTRGLLIGGAALGLPALANLWVARRALALPAPGWGEPSTLSGPEGTVSYQSLGDGAPALLLLHSLGPGHSGLEWRAAAELLAQRRRVLVPDQIGWGESARRGLRYDASLYTTWVSRFLDEISGTAVIVGAGISAAYAVAAAKNSDQVIGLGLVTPRGLGFEGPLVDRRDALVNRMLRLPVLGTSALNVFTRRISLATHLRREVYADASKVDDALIEQHYRLSHLPGAHSALAAYLGGRLSLDVRPQLSSVRQPVWIAWGRDARSPAVESADRVAARAELRRSRGLRWIGDSTSRRDPRGLRRGARRFPRQAGVARRAGQTCRGIRSVRSR